MSCIKLLGLYHSVNKCPLAQHISCENTEARDFFIHQNALTRFRTPWPVQELILGVLTRVGGLIMQELH
jgi:hypothetical protein